MPLISWSKDTLHSHQMSLLIQRSVKMIESLWLPYTTTTKIISTSSYIHELLKRSKTTCSVLQLALYYLFHNRKRIQQAVKTTMNPYIKCGRRMFLASLMIASKYLNDKTFKNKVWAEITLLKVQEINQIETCFLKLINYDIYVNPIIFEKWSQLLCGQPTVHCFPIIGIKRSSVQEHHPTKKLRPVQLNP